MKKNELIEIIEKVSPGISCDTNTFEQSDSIYFGDDFISTYNGEISVYAPFDSGVTGWVKSVEFQKLIKKIKTEDVELTESKDKIQIISGKTKAVFNHVSDEIKIPDLGIKEIKRWKRLPSNFCEAVANCGFSAADDISRGVFTFIFISGSIAESCDNFRVTRYPLDGELNDDLLISKSSSKYLPLYSPTHYNITNGWIHLCNKDNAVVYSVRTCNDKYPNLDELFELGKKESFDFPEEIKDSLGTVEILAEESSNGQKIINIEVKKNKMVLSGENETGSIKDEIAIKYKGEEFEFAVASQYLQAIISSLKKCYISIKKGKILFENKNFKHVLSLIKK